GFVDIFYFRYSFVADHFQYIASVGIVACMASGIVSVLGLWRLWARPLGTAICLAVIVTLAGLSWQQSRMYRDIESFYRTIIRENPGCWLAYNNLGNLLLGE